MKALDEADLEAALEREYDVVVVGAGGAGMTAALSAAKHGLTTILIEKSSYFGGNTARSGGGVWIPGNYALESAKQVDPGDRDAAKTYLDSIVGDRVPKVRRDTYLDRGPEVMDFIRANTPVRFQWVPQYADYLPEQPGGRPAGRSGRDPSSGLRGLRGRNPSSAPLSRNPPRADPPVRGGAAAGW